jgi:hypothetical protein
MKRKYIILLLVFAALFQACDKIEEPFIKEGSVVWNGRKIIIYDFTGHKCGNCPRAHETVESMIERYGEAIVPIAIHTTSFARVMTTDTTLPFHTDFRTDIGDFLGGRDMSTGYYGELALPTGLVNNLGVSALMPHTSWGTEIAKQISSFPEYLVNIESAYSQTDSTISADIEIITNINNSRKLSLIVFVTEDHIIDWQTDYSATPDKIEFYEHNHVLRAGFNGSFGDIIKNDTNQTMNGDKINKIYSLKTEADWKIENCSVVAFVYDEDTEEILQAEILQLSE